MIKPIEENYRDLYNKKRNEKQRNAQQYFALSVILSASSTIYVGFAPAPSNAAMFICALLAIIFLLVGLVKTLQATSSFIFISDKEVHLLKRKKQSAVNLEHVKEIEMPKTLTKSIHHTGIDGFRKTPFGNKYIFINEDHHDEIDTGKSKGYPREMIKIIFTSGDYTHGYLMNSEDFKTGGKFNKARTNKIKG